MKKLFFGLTLLALFLSGCTPSSGINSQSASTAGEPALNVIEQEASTDATVEELSDDEINERQVALDKACECQKEFKESYPIEWSGYVMSIFLSGEAIGVKRFDQSGKYKQFMVRTNGLYDGGGDKVRIKGSMVGMTCAYYNTIFGECVPDVVATVIEIIK